MRPKVFSPADQADVLAILREIHKVEGEIAELERRRSTEGTLERRHRRQVRQLERRRLDLLSQADAYRERGDLISLNVDTLADECPLLLDRFSDGLVEILARKIALEHHEAEDRARRGKGPTIP